jgi:hypothetical protein
MSRLELGAMEPFAVARDLVMERFPHARASFLAGSALTPRRTATSDLDVVVVVPVTRPYRETVRHLGRLVELFVHTRDSLDDFWAAETAQRRSPLLRMCAEGLALSPGDDAEEIQHAAALRWRQGPRPLTAAETERRRYMLTDLLDDLATMSDPLERPYVAAAVLQSATELALLLGDHWLGTGKWLSRELADAEPALLTRLVQAHADAVAGRGTSLITVSEEILGRAGGRLADGYHQGTDRPLNPGPSVSGG